MEQSEKDFLKRMLKSGIKLPSLDDKTVDKIQLDDQPEFIKELVVALEKKEKDDTEMKSFQESLKAENFLAQELIDQFIPADLKEADLFGGRNVSDYVWLPAGAGLNSFLKERIDKVDDHLEIQIDTTTKAEFRLLSWYKNTMLIKLSDESWPESGLHLYYLLGDGETLYRLNGTSPPIHEINAKNLLQFNNFNVIEYLMFFCFFVRGEEGPFYVVEHVEDAFLPQNDKVLEVIGSVAHKASTPTQGADGNFQTNVVIFYSNAVFAAQFSIQATGMVEMLTDEPVAADLPDKVHQPVVHSPSTKE